MANFNSQQVNDGSLYRGNYEGVTQSATGRIHLKTGTLLTVGDVLRFVGLGQKTAPTKLSLRVVGELEGAGVSSLTGSIGTFQILKDGAPLVVSDGPAPLNTYTSPATAAASIRAAAALPENDQIDIPGGDFVTPAPDGYAGPVEIGIAITATGVSPIVADADLYLTVEYAGRNALPGELSQKPGVPNGAF